MLMLSIRPLKLVSLLLASIGDMVLVQEKDFETPGGPRAPMDVSEFYDSLETKRMARLDGLVQQYNSIENLLIKVRCSSTPVAQVSH